ncbi:MAG: AtpZ/AtpI family protein [Ignavibacteriales bacterium]|jgi:F0F1-type ATP synthase assembly protein I|nr:AtpZ/AtpI family protein [Ignavibacteriales bacterium]
MKNEFDKIESTYSKIGPYLGLGTQLAASVILMFFLGKYLDEKFSLFPWLTISFSALGSFAGIYNFIKSVLNLNKKEKLESKD